MTVNTPTTAVTAAIMPPITMATWTGLLEKKPGSNTDVYSLCMAFSPRRPLGSRRGSLRRRYQARLPQEPGHGCEGRRRDDRTACLRRRAEPPRRSCHSRLDPMRDRRCGPLLEEEGSSRELRAERPRVAR